MDELRAQQLAYILSHGGKITPPKEVYVEDRFYGKVYSKGRPQFTTKSNHAFTPKNTREFERLLKTWMEGFDVEGIYVPVRVTIILYDKIPVSARKVDGLFMKQGLKYSGVGDVDNRAKSILDAMNDNFLEDDKQVVDLHISRLYDYDEGFYLKVERAGFAAYELDMIREHYVQQNTRRRTKMG